MILSPLDQGSLLSSDLILYLASSDAFSRHGWEQLDPFSLALVNKQFYRIFGPNGTYWRDFYLHLLRATGHTLPTFVQHRYQSRGGHPTIPFQHNRDCVVCTNRGYSICRAALWDHKEMWKRQDYRDLCRNHIQKFGSPWPWCGLERLWPLEFCLLLVFHREDLGFLQHMYKTCPNRRQFIQRLRSFLYGVASLSPEFFKKVLNFLWTLPTNSLSDSIVLSVTQASSEPLEMYVDSFFADYPHINDAALSTEEVAYRYEITRRRTRVRNAMVTSAFLVMVLLVVVVFFS